MRKSSNKKSEKYDNIISLMNMVNIMVIIGLIIFAGLCLLFLKRPEYSEQEKRALAECPELSFQSYINGSFTPQFTNYFADTVPLRQQLVSAGASLKSMMGIKSPTFYGQVNIVADDEGNAVTSDIVTEVTSITSDSVSEENVALESTETQGTESEEEVKDIAEFNNNGIIVDGVKMYGEDAGVMLFGSNHTQAERYANIINSYKQALGENVNVYNLVVPTSVEFYLPKKYKKYSSSQKDSIDYIYSHLSEDVIPVDAYSALSEHSDEYIYFRTDHHWTPLGAYYAYTAFAKTLGMEYPDITKYEERVKQGFVGSLYGYTNDAKLKNSPEEFHYYIPQNVTWETSYYYYDTLKFEGKSDLFYEYVEGGNCYGMFLGADAIHAKIKTNVNNGRKIVVFKESYGNAFVPFLVNNFEEIYVIDIRFFGTNALQYIKDVGATDVLFINNAFAANTSKLIKGIEMLYNRQDGTVVTTVQETTVPSETEKKESSDVPPDSSITTVTEPSVSDQDTTTETADALTEMQEYIYAD